MFEESFNKFKRSKFSSQTPTMSPFLLLGGLGLFWSYKNILLNPISFIKTVAFEDSSIPILEPQKVQKNSILFDYRDFLSCNKFSLSRFDLLNVKRMCCEELLFYLAHYYELICVSDGIPLISDLDLKELDPLGCISYKIFINNKKDLKPENLNRNLNDLTVISTSPSEFHSCFDKNILILPKFRGEKDDRLLDLVHFFTNLHFSKVTDVRSVLQSYKNCDFFKSFKNIQERLFNQRNLFTFENFHQKLEHINQKKIDDYRQVKAKFYKPESLNMLKESAVRFMRSVFL